MPMLRNPRRALGREFRPNLDDDSLISAKRNPLAYLFAHTIEMR